MVDYRDIREFEKSGTFYGKSFTVVIWHPAAGQPYVKEVRIEDLPVIKGPDHDPVETLDEAIAVGFRIACGVIGGEH